MRDEDAHQTGPSVSGEIPDARELPLQPGDLPQEPILSVRGTRYPVRRGERNGQVDLARGDFAQVRHPHLAQPGSNAPRRQPVQGSALQVHARRVDRRSGAGLLLCFRHVPRLRPDPRRVGEHRPGHPEALRGRLPDDPLPRAIPDVLLQVPLPDQGALSPGRTRDGPVPGHPDRTRQAHPGNGPGTPSSSSPLTHRSCSPARRQRS